MSGTCIELQEMKSNGLKCNEIWAIMNYFHFFSIMFDKQSCLMLNIYSRIVYTCEVWCNVSNLLTAKEIKNNLF